MVRFEVISMHKFSPDMVRFEVISISPEVVRSEVISIKPRRK